MAQQRFYIRIPVPSGSRQDHWDYREVDNTRIGLSMLTELWIKDREGRYLPAPTADTSVHQPFDVSTLLESLATIMDQCRATLAGFDEAGQKVGELLEMKTSLETLIRELANGHPAKADAALRDGLYGLMSVATELAEALSNLEGQTSGQEVAIERLSESIASKDEIAANFYLEWAEAAGGLVAAVTELEEHEKCLRALRSEVEKARRQWEALVSEDTPALAEAVDFLEENFIFEAQAYLRSHGPQESQESMEAALETARTHLATCRAAEQQAVLLWETMGKRVGGDAKRRENVAEQLNALKQHSVTFRDCAKRFPQGTARPHEISDAPISRECHERAEEIVNSARWSPLEAKRRLDGLCASLGSMAEEKPMLPRSISDALSIAERLIADINHTWATPSAPPAAEEVDEVEEATPATASVPAEIDQTRADELYELMICVGWVLSCNRQPFGQTSVQSTLWILMHHGRLSKEDIYRYLPALQARATATSEAERVSSLKEALQRWQTSNARWILYKVQRVKGDCFKLTLHSEPYAIELMRKHGLTIAGIRQAHEKKKLEQELAYKAYTQSNPR